MLKIVVGSHAGMALGRESWCQFPETKERGLDFRFLGYFFFPAVVLWVVPQNVLSCHVLLISLVCEVLYPCLRTKKFKTCKPERPASFIFFCSNPFPSLCLADRTAEKPPMLCVAVDFKIPARYKGQKGSFPGGYWDVNTRRNLSRSNPPRTEDVRM